MNKILPLSPMRVVCLEFASKTKTFVAVQLSHKWLESKGDWPRASSRSNFGNNSASINCIRSLVQFGFLKETSMEYVHKITESGRHLVGLALSFGWENLHVEARPDAVYIFKKVSQSKRKTFLILLQKELINV